MATQWRGGHWIGRWNDIDLVKKWMEDHVQDAFSGAEVQSEVAAHGSREHICERGEWNCGYQHCGWLCVYSCYRHRFGLCSCLTDRHSKQEHYVGPYGGVADCAHVGCSFLPYEVRG